MHYNLISVFVTCQKIENKEPISCGLFSFILLEIKAELWYKENSWCVYEQGEKNDKQTFSWKLKSLDLQNKDSWDA